jgi:hypothetical protein
MADDADKELKIKILTEADTSGAKSAAEGLENVRQKLAGDNGTSAASAVAAEGFEKLREKLADKSGSESFLSEFENIRQRMEGTYQGVRDVRSIFMELDRILPGSGQLLEAVFTGPLGLIVAAGYGLDQLVTVLTKVEEHFQAILSKDLTGPINQAAALAELYNGVADAIAKANSEFNSPEGIFGRTEKGIEAQRGLSESQRLQADLAAKVTESTNANIQAANAQHKAESFKLPQSDDEAKKQIDALRIQGKEHQDAADQLRKEAAARSDMQATASKSLAGFILAAVTHPVEMAKAMAGMAGKTTVEGVRESQQKTADEQAQALKLDREANSIEALVKRRDAARTEAESKAESATKISNDAAWESDPNNVGSIAWKQAQQRNFSSGESAAAAALQRAADDLKTHGPGAVSGETMQRQRSEIRVGREQRQKQDRATNQFTRNTGIASPGNAPADSEDDRILFEIFKPKNAK